MRLKPRKITPTPKPLSISAPEISFSFKYLQKTSYDKCSETTFFVDLFGRLKSLGQLGWSEISKSHRHSYGYEKIPLSRIKKVVQLTDDVRHLLVFRATGNNHVFLGFREGNIFHIVFIEAKFGDIYEH